MKLPPKSFVFGCVTGMLLGAPLLFAGLTGLVLLFQEPLSRMMAEQQAQRLKPLRLGQDARATYDWPLQDLNGNRRTLEEWQGKPLLLHFWKPDCVPCLAELPSLSRLHGQLAGAEVEVLTIVTGADAGKAAGAQGVSLPVYIAEEIPEVFRTGATPSTFVVAADGRVVFAHRGAANWNDEEVLAFLRGMSSSDVATATMD